MSSAGLARFLVSLPKNRKLQRQNPEGSAVGSAPGARRFSVGTVRSSSFFDFRKHVQQTVDVQTTSLELLNLSECTDLEDAAAEAIGQHCLGVTDLCLYGLLKVSVRLLLFAILTKENISSPPASLQIGLRFHCSLPFLDCKE